MAYDEGEREEYGVLLYYKYTDISDLNELLAFYESNCDSLALLGRVRLAPHGVNVTVGGKLSSLVKHIDAVKLNSLFEGTDFKLASCHQPLDDQVAKECGFTSLSIRVVKELVTFSSNPLHKSPEIVNAGSHLTAAEFHSVLQNAETDGNKNIILLDARNLYETRIGKFHTPNVETLDPGIRQYSDLPSWIDGNSEQLKGNHVLMYCTGGIRCEMASAYIKSKGAGFENVYQLFGGIQRYLEQYPDGGFFRGKNFVFDHRISVGSSDKNVLGTCLLCGRCFDDYNSRCRCAHCRMLVLVCDSCQKEDSVYACELCQKHGKCIEPHPSTENDCLQASLVEFEAVSTADQTTPIHQLPLGQGTRPPRKLKILCLHGFRQNASSFKGRTASLAKKLKNMVDLVFIDAPLELPFIFQHSSTETSLLQQSPPPLENCKKKFAWLVGPELIKKSETDWKVADRPFDPLQYQHQTEGFDESLAYLKTVLSHSGPFDGILGFSQGAAMAASVCARGRLDGAINIRFVILCSGFGLDSLDLRQGSIPYPSLHIFGSDKGKDRQISSQVSRELASLFDDGCSVVIEHNSGHIIPTGPPFIDQIKDFLQRFH